MEFDPQTLEQYRLKLRYKARYQLGAYCPDVEDIVQETLTRCVTALRDKKVHNPDSMGAFLSGICNNVILEYWRRLWREMPVDDVPQAEAHTPTVASVAHVLELRQAVAAALAELSDRDCDLLRDFFLQEMDKDEICRKMGLTDSQFRVALFRAKERFRKIYRQSLKHGSGAQH
jgi:RNA polymerase sigma factor (sigma-70 family)